jgi:hypothetical protein
MTAAFAFPLLRSTPPVLIAIIADAAQDVLSHHGASAFEASRHAAIAHEAGHAVVATHEGFTIRQVMIFSRLTNLGTLWGGRCLEAGGAWTSGPDSTADEDLRRARVVIAGLAGEAVVGLDKPGSSLDELALSQVIGCNVYAKRNYDPTLNEAEAEAACERLWHERVWRVATAILCANREPFIRVAERLNQYESARGGALRKALAQVKRIAP